MASTSVRRSRALVRERAVIARDALLDVDGVVDVVIGGSVGRGEEWAFSDVDLIPITAGPPAEALERVLQMRERLEADWEATGVPQVVDVRWLAFSVTEAEATASNDARWLADRLADARWLYGTDKAAVSPVTINGVADAFAAALTASRSDATVRAARYEAWMAMVYERLDEAMRALSAGRLDDALASAGIAGPLSAAILEKWGAREGSMTKFTTHFERVAAEHAASDLLTAVQSISMTGVDAVLADVPDLSAHLQTRVDETYEARVDAGETVSEEQNRRDQILLFLGRDGLPDAITRLRRHVPDESEHIDRVAATVADVHDLSFDT